MREIETSEKTNSQLQQKVSNLENEVNLLNNYIYFDKIVIELYQLSRTIRERDIAISQVAHFKADKTRLTQELKTITESKTTEVTQLTFRCATLTETARSLDAEKMAMATLHEQVINNLFTAIVDFKIVVIKESEKLRAAHSRSLEMLMELQEENDLLRSTVF